MLSYNPESNFYYWYDSVDDYLKGVLNKELFNAKWGRRIALQQDDPTEWQKQAGYLEAYKAQAIAARNMLINWQKRNKANNKFYDVENSQAQQADDNAFREDCQNHLDALSVHAQVIKYAAYGEVFTEATFFSNTTYLTGTARDVTLNSENAIAESPWNYKPYLRNSSNVRSDETVETNNASLANPGGHGVGMSQFGAMHLSKHDSMTFEQILKHYFHPAPPYVARIRVLLGTPGATYQDSSLYDKFDSGSEPERAIQPDSTNWFPQPITATDDLYITVYFSEDMDETSIEVQVEGMNGVREPVSKEGYDAGNRTWSGKVLKNRIPIIGPGSPKVCIKGRHKYVTTWWLDSTPFTVSFDGTENPSKYDQGEDKTHSFLIKQAAPKKATNVIIRGGNGNAQVAWTGPEYNSDETLLTDLAGYRVYYSTNLNDENPPWEWATTTSVQLTLPNDNTPYYVTVTALDSVGNESEFSDIVSVRPLVAARWVHPNGQGPSGSYTSIADALSGISDGTTVIVGPGEYYEPELLVGGGSQTLGFVPKDIRLQSERGPGETKILGNTRLEVADGCSVIGFTIADEGGRGIDAVFASDLLIANNIFVSNLTGIYTAGHHEDGDDRAVRIYNNVFIGNVSYSSGIMGYMDYNLVDVQNNIFQGTGTDVTGISLEYCTPVVVKYNAFYGNQTDIASRGYVPLVTDKFSWAPGFVDFNSTDPLESDFHLVQSPVAGNGVDQGSPDLQYKEVKWDMDCDGSGTDLGAYGGPFAYVDNDLPEDPGYGIPDCLEPVAVAGTMVVLKNSVDQPVTLQAQNPAGEITYNVVTQPNGTLTGDAPNLAYTVTPDSLEPDSLSFTVANAVGESAPAPITILVKEMNHPPEAGDQTLVLEYGAVGEVTLQGTDVDGDALSFVIDSNSEYVSCPYPPTCYVLATESGPATKSFSYHVDDGTAASASATVSIILESPFRFLLPAADSAVYTNAASTTLQWGDAPSSDARITIYAGGTLPENLIAADIPESDPANAFAWDISALSEGTYPISATITDEWTTRWEDGGSLVIDRTQPEVSADLAEGLYPTAQTVNFVVSETVDVHCTTDGSDPTAASPLCDSPFDVSDTMTLKYLAIDPAGNVSSILSKSYVIDNPPLSIGLSPSSIAENQSIGAVVGNLSTSDPDPGDSFSYALDPDLLDNNSFQIVGGALQSGVSLDFEAKNSYTVLLRSTDQDGLSVQTTHAIVVTDVNDPPSAVALSQSQVAEHQPVGTPIGTLSTSDEDAGSTFSYSLVPVAQVPDNAFFQIDGDVLKTNAEFVYTLTKHSYTIRVSSTDQGGLSVEQDFAVTIQEVNESPTDIALSAGSIPENQPSGTVVGALSTTDPDVENTFTYLLDSGGVDNSFFQIVGNSLQTAASFNYESRHSYDIMVRSTDQGGLFLSKNFTITVTDANDRPWGITLNNASVVEKAAVGSPVGTLASTDEDPGNTFTYALTSGSGSEDNARFQIVGNLLKTNAVFTWQIKPSYTIKVRTTDQGGLSTEQSFTIEVRRRRVRNDFDGDRRSDIGVYYPPGGAWYQSRSTEGFWQMLWGYGGTLPLTGDYDSDGYSDIGLYYPSGGNWYLMESTEGFSTTQFGYTGTIPLSGDFDGDGREDFGCYEAATGKWLVMKSLEGFWQTTFGYSGTIPIVGDFDGDGWDDYGCYYPPGGNWYVMKSRDGFWETQFGYAGTIPVVGDFDGDGRSDIGCYYPPAGNWYIQRSTLGYWQRNLGFAGTEPVVGDYDGDGKSDIGYYYPAGGNWNLLRSMAGGWQTQFGFEGTIPLGGTLR